MLFDWVRDGTDPFVVVGVVVVLVGPLLVLVSVLVVETSEVDVLVGVGLDVDEEVDSEVEVEVESGVEGTGVLGTAPADDELPRGPPRQYLYSLLKLQLVEFYFCLLRDGFHRSRSAFEMSQIAAAAWQLLRPN
jgi:hypothetical protein